MQKIIYCLLALLLPFTMVNAQKKTTSPGGTIPMSAIKDTGRQASIKEALVQLAMQNPLLEIADHKVNMANDELSKTKTKILNNVVLSGNLNEFTIDPGKFQGQVYYPRYNIGATLPLDLFFTRDKEIKIAREQTYIAQATKNQTYREVKEAVLSSYEDYLMLKQKLEFQSQLTQDSYTEYVQQEKDFQEGIIEQKDYNAAFKKWTDEESKKIELQRDLNVVRLQLERMIGKTVEEVIAESKPK